MKKNRQDLEKTLVYIIKEYSRSKRKIRSQLEDKFKELKMSAKVIGIWNGTVPYITINLAELYLFTRALYEITEEECLNPREWFNEEEEKSFILYKPQKPYKNNIIKFYNVDKTSDNRYVCTKATYQEMSEIFAQGLITYNIRTQRETTTIVFNGQYIEIPTIRQNPIVKMTKLMVDGKFTPNMITLNLRKTGEEMLPEYNEKDRTLEIWVDNERSFLDIIDGMHRMSAAMRAVEMNPDIDMYTMISILYYTEEEAQEYIDQEAHHTPISQVHRAAFRNSETSILVAKEINLFGNSTNNEMFNKIALNYEELKSQSKYVTFETFSKAFNYNYKIANPREVSKISKYLKDFFNELIGLLREKGQITFTNNMFICYICISNLLRDKENWKEVLEKITSSTKLDERILSQNLDLKTERITKPLIDKFYKYSVEVINENV